MPAIRRASRSTPATSTGRTTTRARSAAPTSTAPASTRASSPAPAIRRASQSTPATSTGRTPARARSVAPTSTAPARTRASSSGRAPSGTSVPGRASRSTPTTSIGRTRHLGFHLAIGRANLDGTGVNQSFIYAVRALVPAMAGIAVDAGHIYWAWTDLNGHRPRQPRRHRRRAELHHRPRAVPQGVAVDARPRLLGERGHASAAPTSTAPGSNRSFITRHRELRTGHVASRPTPTTSTGRTAQPA